MNKKLKKFISYYKPYKKVLFMDLFCAFIVAMISLVLPMLIRFITNDILVTSLEPLNDILKVALVFLALVLIQFICTFYISYKGHMMGVYMERDMRNDLFSHYQKLSFSFYDNQKTGALMSRLTNDLYTLAELYHHGPEDIVISIVKFLGSFIILYGINPTLTLMVFSLLPFMAIFSYFCGKRMHKFFKLTKKKMAGIHMNLEDNLSGIRVVQSFSNEDNEIERFSKTVDNFVLSKRKSYLAMTQFHSGLGVFMNLINLIVVTAGSIFISNGTLIIGDLVTFLLFINNFTEPIRKLLNFIETFQDGYTGFERFVDIIETNPDIKDSTNAIELDDVKGCVTFRNVGFRYNDKSEYVLQNINLDVKDGEYIALVGLSGAGKTTICSLIPRFYEVTDGEILIDDINIKDIKMKSLRSKIGIVQQDVYLFAGTILENIRYGNLHASEEEVIKAAKNANAHEFISSLPDGYNTDIGQRGVKLSGGQKQRISIARVFLKNPPILIFDEATSSLDNESELIVQQSLEKLAKNRTTFVIAHRLSTIRNAKKIVVLSSDGISESGTHNELIKANGQYSSLYNMQFEIQK
ncbi:MAG: ABC transporter ATP-binding protein [Anaerorhabdus sp.]